MEQLADRLGERTLFGRTGGAATLAVGMAHIFSKAVRGHGLDLWYHFAIMFEALFILTTIDAGTRVGRYLLQDVLGQLWQPLGRTGSLRSNLIASLLMVAGWGYFLVQGVRDPLGGINSLWPLFGIANQMLAAIALCLATTIILKMELTRAEKEVKTASSLRPRPLLLALITFIPLVWLLGATMTAGVQKIWHPDARIGFLAQARELQEARPQLEQALETAQAGGAPEAITGAEKALKSNRVLHFNNVLDAAVAGTFLLLVSGIAILSVREWLLLLGRHKLAVLRETDPVWLPEYKVVESRSVRVMGVLALAGALARELSGEAQLERAELAQQAQAREHRLYRAEDGHHHRPNSQGAAPKSRQALYTELTEDRFNGVRRCC